MPRDDRSLILYPSPEEALVRGRSERRLALVALREARSSYHSLRARRISTDLEDSQVRWKLRELGAGLGVRLVISGSTDRAQGFAELN